MRLTINFDGYIPAGERQVGRESAKVRFFPQNLTNVPLCAFYAPDNYIRGLQTYGKSYAELMPYFFNANQIYGNKQIVITNSKNQQWLVAQGLIYDIRRKFVVASLTVDKNYILSLSPEGKGKIKIPSSMAYVVLFTGLKSYNQTLYKEIHYWLDDFKGGFMGHQDPSHMNHWVLGHPLIPELKSLSKTKEILNQILPADAIEE